MVVRAAWLRRGVAAVAVATAFVGATAWAADTTISVIDGVGRQQGTSMALDASGNPVLSYTTLGPKPPGLMVVHCNDPACAGGDDTPAFVAPTSGIGECCRTQLQLDAAGNAVVAYQRNLSDQTFTNYSELWLVSCNDPACTGGDETLNLIASSVTNANYPWGLWNLRLDSSGYPIWSWVKNGQLQVTRCNDPLCDGGDETPNVVDLLDLVPQSVPAPVMELDASGNPVIAYGKPALAIVHCNDPACVDGDETVHVIDTVPTALAASLQLDASGMPVILYDRYVSSDEHELRLVHCNDRDCTDGDETPSVIETSDVMGGGSMRLDSFGNPTFTYAAQPSEILKLMRCNDDSCRGGDETTNLIDSTPYIWDTELRLDVAGNPIVAYIEHDLSPDVIPYAYDLRLAHCGTPDCSPNAAAPVPSTPQDAADTTVAVTTTPDPPTVPTTENPAAVLLPPTGTNNAVGVAAVMLSAAGVLLVFAARRRTHNAPASSASSNK